MGVKVYGKYILKDIQANILKAHGKKFADYHFISFYSNQKRVRDWLSEFANSIVTTTEDQLGHSEIITNISLTNRAYQLLGLGKSVPDDCSFVFSNDDKKVTTRIGIGSYPYWETYYHNGNEVVYPTHAMVMIAADTCELLKAGSNTLSRSLIDVGFIKISESSNRLPRFKGHFGYVDGISQPDLIRKFEKAVAG
ncbi:MAG: hypothetical protein AAGC85_11825, partial [Bacteroidota bacterium]